MRFSALFAGATALLASFAQAHPVAPVESVELAARVAPAHELASRSSSSFSDNPEFASLIKRSSRWNGARVACPSPFVSAPAAGFPKAVKELRKRTDKPSLAKAGKYPTCEDLCFKDGTQISWCNQDNKRKTLVSWNSVAEGIEVMLKQSKCSSTKDGKKMMGGGIYHSTNWYVFAGQCWPDRK